MKVALNTITLTLSWMNKEVSLIVAKQNHFTYDFILDTRIHALFGGLNLTMRNRSCAPFANTWVVWWAPCCSFIYFFLFILVFCVFVFVLFVFLLCLVTSHTSADSVHSSRRGTADLPEVYRLVWCVQCFVYLWIVNVRDRTH